MGNTDFRMERHTMIFRRRFRATNAQVYAAWTDAVQFAQWFGPEVASADVQALDARIGAAWRIVLRMPDGVHYPLKGVYSEVIPDKCLVFTMDTSEHPNAWHEMLDSLRDTPTGARAGGIVATVTLVAADHDCEMTVSQRFDESSDRDAHYHMGSPKGWGESFDRLERFLAR